MQSINRAQCSQSIDQSIHKQTNLFKKQNQTPGWKYGLLAIQLTLEQQWGWLEALSLHAA